MMLSILPVAPFSKRAFAQYWQWYGVNNHSAIKMIRSNSDSRPACPLVGGLAAAKAIMAATGGKSRTTREDAVRVWIGLSVYVAALPRR